MKSRANATNCKLEIEEAGTVRDVEIRQRREIKPTYERVVLKITTKPKGYSFDIIHDRYPTFEIVDVGIEYGEISLIATVDEIKEPENTKAT